MPLNSHPILAQELRLDEYPMLKDLIYLDHAGTTLYAKSLLDRFSANMLANLYGNPHSSSASSQLTTQSIERIRTSLLGLFSADPAEFDVVFVANATAGIKLVMEAFQNYDGGFWYGYHKDAHTSLVGVREVAASHSCFMSDSAVEEWIRNKEVEDVQVTQPALFAYPAQSNMNGRRLPLDWSRRMRFCKKSIYTLLDAAALLSTSPLDLADVDAAPDFTVLSLYKMFGFPDLGALVVRRQSAPILQKRRYFGGGTVDAVVVSPQNQWHAKKDTTLHDRLEDGTLPIHSIIALEVAMTVHTELYGSFTRISQYTSFLAAELFDGLSRLKHWNQSFACQTYKDDSSSYNDAKTQGPIVAFNVRDESGAWISCTEVEKLASVQGFQIRTGGLCNPGGIAQWLHLTPSEVKNNYAAGQRCSSEQAVIGAKPAGMIRVSLGAMSTEEDVRRFIAFVSSSFVQSAPPRIVSSIPISAGTGTVPLSINQFYVESLSIYPIKSCAAFNVPVGKAWEVRREGLAWDREWCLVNQATGVTLSQKQYPKMALIQPVIDFEANVLRVQMKETIGTSKLEIPLFADPRTFSSEDAFVCSAANVCGDPIKINMYTSRKISNFFTQALGVACQLARFPANNGCSQSSSTARYAKPGLRHNMKRLSTSTPGAFPEITVLREDTSLPQPILLSNESPVLVITRSSLNRLNELIKAKGGKAAQAEAFRANIVVAENPEYPPGTEQAYIEDEWCYLQIGLLYFEVLGPCRRCQMICVDQRTAERDEEPLTTLSKVRRFNGRVYFGQHSRWVPVDYASSAVTYNGAIMVGDLIRSFVHGEALPEALGNGTSYVTA